MRSLVDARFYCKKKICGHRWNRHIVNLNGKIYCAAGGRSSWRCKCRYTKADYTKIKTVSYYRRIKSIKLVK